MPKALDLPDDLIALARTSRDAELAMETAARENGDVETARSAFVDAALAVRAHPIWEQARQEGCHHQTWQALKDAAKQPAA